MKESPKLLHQYIRSKKVGVPSAGPLKLDSGELIADCGEMAYIFTSNFSLVYATEDPSAPFPHQHLDATIDSVSISLDEVRTRLASLDVNSSMGPDGLHPCLHKSCPNLAILLHLIFKQSLLQGRLPGKWKKSEIVPIFKKESTHSSQL